MFFRTIPKNSAFLQKWTKPQMLAFVGAFLITACFAVLWHAVLFEQHFLNLDVFTRMDAPLYHFGLLAWGLDALKVAWLLGVFAAALTLFGIAAKVRIDDLTLWFLLTGGFIFLRTTLLGLWLGSISAKFRGRDQWAPPRHMRFARAGV